MEPEGRKALSFKIQDGTVQFMDGAGRAAWIAPEAFTQGWAKHAMGKGDGSWDGLIPLSGGSGPIGVKCFVDACPEPHRDAGSGFRVRYGLTPSAPARVIHLRVVVSLPYGDWVGAPFRLGPVSGRVPADPPADIRLAEASSAPLFLGPSADRPALRLEAPGLHTVLQDNRQWTPHLQAFVTRNEPSEAPWEWKAGEERFYEFSLCFGP